MRWKMNCVPSSIRSVRKPDACVTTSTGTPKAIPPSCSMKQEALTNHANAPHMQAMHKKTAAMRARSDVQIWEEVDVLTP